MKSLSSSKPHVIIVVGLPGSGKTFFAEKFTAMFSAPYVNYKFISEHCTNEEAASAVFDHQLGELLKTKQSIVIEGKCETRTERMELTKKARAADYDTLLIWVQTDAETAKARSEKNKTNPKDFATLAKRFTPPNASEKPVVISGKHTYASQAKVVLKKLSSPRADITTHSTPPLRAERPSRRNITIR